MWAAIALALAQPVCWFTLSQWLNRRWLKHELRQLRIRAKEDTFLKVYSQDDLSDIERRFHKRYPEAAEQMRSIWENRGRLRMAGPPLQQERRDS